jgi:RNA polymerase sigma factor for flagellar operon FliA
MSMKEGPDSPEVLQLVHEGRSLVNVIARRLLGMYRNADLEEFIADGQVGLLKAARQYDAGTGTAFRTWAKPFIEGAMVDGHRRRAPLPRRVHEKINASRDEGTGKPAAEESERRLRKHFAGMAGAQVDGLLARIGIDTQGGNIAISTKTSAEAASLREEMKRLVLGCIESLPAKEAFVVQRHWLDDVPLDRVAKELGLPETTTRELRDRARTRMAKRLSHLR